MPTPESGVGADQARGSSATTRLPSNIRTRGNDLEGAGDARHVELGRAAHEIRSTVVRHVDDAAEREQGVWIMRRDSRTCGGF